MTVSEKLGKRGAKDSETLRSLSKGGQQTLWWGT